MASFNRTLCEINGELINDDGSKTQYMVDNDISMYPQVQMTSDTLLRSTLVLNETAQSAFLEHSETFSQKLAAAWHGHGLIGVLTEVCDNSTEVSLPVRNACHYLLVSLRWLNGMQFTLFPHLKLSNEALICTFSDNNEWLLSPIRYLAWHPRANKFALALRDDTIRIYYADVDLIPMLKHKLQRNISTMAWKPLSASVLAVATQTVILLWTVDPSSLSTRPSASAAQVLSYPGHSPITSIAWCPHGSDRLYAVSALNSALVVWSAFAKEYQVIQHMTTSGGVSRISFSPDGSKMLAATPGSSFRVFETVLWTNERWSKLAGRIQTSCWGPDGTFLLFALFGDPRIYSLTFADSRSFDLPVIDGSKHASVAVDLTPVPDEDCRCSQNIGDNQPKFIHSMVLDGSGERLAVMFSKTDPRFFSIALFTVSSNPVLTLSQSGFINGEEGAFPTFIAFKPNYANGALLTICYSSGEVSYVPMYFQALNNNSNLMLTPVKQLSFQQNQSNNNASRTMWSLASYPSP